MIMRVRVHRVDVIDVEISQSVRSLSQAVTHSPLYSRYSAMFSE